MAVVKGISWLFVLMFTILAIGYNFRFSDFFRVTEPISWVARIIVILLVLPALWSLVQFIRKAIDKVRN